MSALSHTGSALQAIREAVLQLRSALIADPALAWTLRPLIADVELAQRRIEELQASVVQMEERGK